MFWTYSKVRVRIIYISWVRSYNHPKIVFKILISFHFKLYNFWPKNCQIHKLCIISNNTHTFEFRTTLYLFWYKKTWYSRTSYIKLLYVQDSLNFVFSFVCHIICHSTSIEEELTLFTLKKNLGQNISFSVLKNIIKKI